MTSAEAYKQVSQINQAYRVITKQDYSETTGNTTTEEARELLFSVAQYHKEV